MLDLHFEEMTSLAVCGCPEKACEIVILYDSLEIWIYCINTTSSQLVQYTILYI